MNINGSPRWDKVKRTFSELNYHINKGKLSFTTIVWFSEFVICYNKNKNDNTDLESGLLADYLHNKDLFV